MWLAQVEMKVGVGYDLDHRPSFVTFEKGLYYLVRAYAGGQLCSASPSHGESFFALVAFCWRFHLEAWQFLESSV